MVGLVSGKLRSPSPRKASENSKIERVSRAEEVLTIFLILAGRSEVGRAAYFFIHKAKAASKDMSSTEELGRGILPLGTGIETVFSVVVVGWAVKEGGARMGEGRSSRDVEEDKRSSPPFWGLQLFNTFINKACCCCCLFSMRSRDSFTISAWVLFFPFSPLIRRT